MQTKHITMADSLTLGTKQEDHFFDRKAAVITGAKLQKIAVAFANADGGEVYVGIADDKDELDPEKRWNGAPNIEDYNQHIQALTEVQPALPMDLTFSKGRRKERLCAPGTAALISQIESATFERLACLLGEFAC